MFAIREFIGRLRREELGQTSGEYVAIVAVGVLIAITVVWAVLGPAIGQAVSQIASGITNF